ncbi:hypothetical protein ACN38_g3330 [Penicillium nordicum]|uniref:Uncharacterized protein n=1 Tax=Penicillium nordicum TaxID=229535 RepID=A0A0M8PD61_9EURO|nr:hypothetical protein ACN38_g3330 [Penicillium nordicum]
MSGICPTMGLILTVRASYEAYSGAKTVYQSLAAALLATQHEAYVLVDETGTLLLHSPIGLILRDEQPLCQAIC